MRDTRDMSEIIASDTDDGVYLEELSPGEHLEIQTRSRCYHLFNQGDGEVLISGHPEYCPEPVPVRVHGSTWGRIDAQAGIHRPGNAFGVQPPAIPHHHHVTDR